MNGLPAIIKAGTVAKAAGFLGLQDSAGLSLNDNASYIRIAIGDTLPISMSVPKQGAKGGELEPEESSLVPAGRHVMIPIGLKTNATKYHYLISINPELAKYGNISAPTIVSAKELALLEIGFYAIRKVDLASLGWIIQLAVID